MNPVTTISRRLGLNVTGEELDRYGEDERIEIRSAEDYRELLWQHTHDDPRKRGRLLPWQKTHSEIQVRPGELILYGGRRGEFKSLLTGQIILGLMAQGDGCVIASMEMPVEDTLERMVRQAVGVDRPTRDYHDRFFDWAKNHLWFYEQTGEIAERRAIGLARYAIGKMQIRHVVIDSLMTVDFGAEPSLHSTLAGQKRFARALANIARDTGANIHLVAHRRKSQQGKDHDDADDIAGSGDLANLASVVYMISANRAKRELPDAAKAQCDEPDCFVKIEKNRRGPTGRTFGFYLHEQSLQLTESEGRRMEIVEELR